MSRYLIFVYDGDEPCGGMDDLKYRASTIENAIQNFNEYFFKVNKFTGTYEYSHGHIFDMVEQEIVLYMTHTYIPYCKFSKLIYEYVNDVNYKLPEHIDAEIERIKE